MSAITQIQNADVLRHVQPVSSWATSGWYVLKLTGFAVLVCLMAPLWSIVLLMHLFALIEPKSAATLDNVTAVNAR